MAIQVPSPMGERNSRRAAIISEELNSDNQKVHKPNQPYLLNTQNNEVLMFQTIPLQISVDPSTQWAVLASMGRNNPGFQFTGAEDTISFTLTFYSDEENKQDVIKTLKKIEAWSKPDGYKAKVPLIQFVMGSLFKDSRFIIFSCPYTMGLFDRQKNMLPCQATMDLTLKKVANTNIDHTIIKRITT